jgi:4-amino-4-deoxy-L-arabinose transferase-like glycosyltransferase
MGKSKIMAVLKRNEHAYLLFLGCLIVLYSFHLFSFTVFDGFSTFSNDAGTYVFLAQKWSPFYSPSESVSHFWPVQQYPPAFPWLLALTGVSNSLWASHLLVSTLLLVSILCVAWIAYRKLGWHGGLLTIALSLLPGALISSMGILSENLYLLLSLCIYLTYAHFESRKESNWLWYFLLTVLLALLLLTRTIGVSFTAAILVASLMTHRRSSQLTKGVMSAALGSLMLWVLWGFLNPQTGDLTYGNSFTRLTDPNSTVQETVVYLLQVISANSIQILNSWNQYITLYQSNFWSFVFPFGLLVLCLISIALRAFNKKFDAIYLGFYCAIVVVWPHQEQITRFLHPIVFLMLLQPLMLAKEKFGNLNGVAVKSVITVTLGVLIINSTSVHLRLVQQKSTATNINPKLATAYELYASPLKEFDLETATFFVDVTEYMLKSSELVPEGSIVATAKAVNFTVLTGKPAVELVTTNISEYQQFCNLKVKDVDVIFLSRLVTGLNWEGYDELDKYREITSKSWKIEGGASGSVAHVIAIDKARLDEKLGGEKSVCESYRVL